MRILVLFVAMSMLFSCDDDEKGEQDVFAEPGTMKMTINGEQKVSSKTKLPLVSYTPGTGVLGFNAYFSIPSSTTEFAVLGITIYFPTVGEFDILGGGFVAGNSTVLYATPVPNTLYTSYNVSESTVGKVKFTKFDTTAKLMSGTFEVKVAAGPGGEILEITDGSFTDIPIN